MFDFVLFDLDGTLTDPGLGITNSVMYALKKWNIEVENREELYKFIGPPLYESFMKYYGFSRKESEKAVEVYREYFSAKGLYENSVYEGVPELLCALKSSGKTLIVASSKPEKFVREILKYFRLDGYFHTIAGATMDGSRINKSDVIKYALTCAGVTDISRCVMIGDREHDIIGAKHFSMKSIGVLYGYGNESEHIAAGADYIVKNAADIAEILGVQICR